MLLLCTFLMWVVRIGAIPATKLKLSMSCCATGSSVNASSWFMVSVAVSWNRHNITNYFTALDIACISIALIANYSQLHDREYHKTLIVCDRVSIQVSVQKLFAYVQMLLTIKVAQENSQGGYQNQSSTQPFNDICKFIDNGLRLRGLEKLSKICR